MLRFRHVEFETLMAEPGLGILEAVGKLSVELDGRCRPGNKDFCC